MLWIAGRSSLINSTRPAWWEFSDTLTCINFGYTPGGSRTPYLTPHTLTLLGRSPMRKAGQSAVVTHQHIPLLVFSSVARLWQDACLVPINQSNKTVTQLQGWFEQSQGPTINNSKECWKLQPFFYQDSRIRSKSVSNRGHVRKKNLMKIHYSLNLFGRPPHTIIEGLCLTSLP